VSTRLAVSSWRKNFRQELEEKANAAENELKSKKSDPASTGNAPEAAADETKAVETSPREEDIIAAQEEENQRREKRMAMRDQLSRKHVAIDYLKAIESEMIRRRDAERAAVTRVMPFSCSSCLDRRSA